MLSYLAFHFFETLYSAFSIFVMAKYIYIQYSILVIILKDKIKPPTQTFSETK